MKKTLLFVAILVISFAFCSQVNAQNKIWRTLFPKLEVEMLNAELKAEDTTIVVNYHLRGSKRRFYNTRLYYSNNKGNSFKGPLRALEGAIGDSLKPGKNKMVAWKFFRDNPYFNGKNIMFKVEAIEVPKIATGGPENAFRSLLIPGFGDTKVRNGYNYGWITAVTYGLLGTGAYFNIRSNQKYNDYQARIPNTEAEHRDLFNQAKNSQNLARGFYIAGAAIWIADIVGVYIKGKRNRQAQKEAEEAEAPEEETAKLWKPQVLPTFDAGTNSSQLSFIWKF